MNYWDKLMGDDVAAAHYMETYGEGIGSKVRTEILALVNSGESVLDVGCGPGWNMESFQEVARRYKGTDYSNRFVRVANQRRRETNISPEYALPFELQDCRDLKEPDKSWDVVVLQDCLEHTDGYAYNKDECPYCIKTSNSLSVRGNNDNIEQWNVSKKTAQNLESQQKVNLGKSTKETNAINIIENNVVLEEVRAKDTLTKTDTSESLLKEREKENTESLWNRNSEENSKAGKASTILTELETITDQRTLNSGSEELDTDRGHLISSAAIASNRICTKHGPIAEALRVSRRRVIVTFWHLTDDDNPHINDDGDDGYGAWYDKRQWEKFLDSLDLHWLGDEFNFPDNRLRHIYVIDKEVK